MLVCQFRIYVDKFKLFYNIFILIYSVLVQNTFVTIRDYQFNFLCFIKGMQPRGIERNEQ